MKAPQSIELLADAWAGICDLIPGSFAPRVERLEPDDRILFSVRCGARHGRGSVTIQLALESSELTLEALMAQVIPYVQDQLVAACPFARKALTNETKAL